MRKLSAGSGASGERTTPTPSAGSSSSVVNRNNDRTQSSFSSSFGSPSRRAGDDGKNGSGTARSFARWRRKRSAPLYSVVRFRSSPGWRGAGEDDRSSSANDATGGRRRRRGRPCRGRWDYVADNVRLGKEEEEALRSEGGDDDDDDDFGGDRDEEDGTSDDDDDDDDEGGDERMATACHNNRTIGEDSVGILIRLYRTTLEDCLCSRDDDDDDDDVDVDGSGGVDSTTAADHPTTRRRRCRRAILDLSRLHVLRALRYAAEYSVRSNGVVDRPGPRTFFSFFGGGGGGGGGGGRGGGGGHPATFDGMGWP